MEKLCLFYFCFFKFSFYRLVPEIYRVNRWLGKTWKFTILVASAVTRSDDELSESFSHNFIKSDRISSLEMHSDVQLTGLGWRLKDRFCHCTCEKVFIPGLVNLVPAVSYLFCLNLPAAFSQPRTKTFFGLCTLTGLYRPVVMTWRISGCLAWGTEQKQEKVLTHLIFEFESKISFIFPSRNVPILAKRPDRDEGSNGRDGRKERE